MADLSVTEDELPEAVRALATDQEHKLVVRPLRGKVWVRFMDEHFRPIEDASCQLFREGAAIASGRTDERGVVGWRDLLMTIYDVEIQIPGQRSRWVALVGVPWLQQNAPVHNQVIRLGDGR